MPHEKPTAEDFVAVEELLFVMDHLFGYDYMPTPEEVKNRRFDLKELGEFPDDPEKEAETYFSNWWKQHSESLKRCFFTGKILVLQEIEESVRKKVLSEIATMAVGIAEKEHPFWLGALCKIHSSENYMGPECPRDFVGVVAETRRHESNKKLMVRLDFLKATHAGLWKTCWFYEDDLEVIEEK